MQQSHVFMRVELLPRVGADKYTNMSAGLPSRAVPTSVAWEQERAAARPLDRVSFLRYRPYRKSCAKPQPAVADLQRMLPSLHLYKPNKTKREPKHSHAVKSHPPFRATQPVPPDCSPRVRIGTHHAAPIESLGTAAPPPVPWATMGAETCWSGSASTDGHAAQHDGRPGTAPTAAQRVLRRGTPTTAMPRARTARPPTAADDGRPSTAPAPTGSYMACSVWSMPPAKPARQHGRPYATKANPRPQPPDRFRVLHSGRSNRHFALSWTRREADAATGSCASTAHLVAEVAETHDFRVIAARFEILQSSPVEVELGPHINTASLFFRMYSADRGLGLTGWHVLANHGNPVLPVPPPRDFAVAARRNSCFMA